MTGALTSGSSRRSMRQLGLGQSLQAASVQIERCDGTENVIDAPLQTLIDLVAYKLVRPSR